MNQDSQRIVLAEFPAVPHASIACTITKSQAVQRTADFLAAFAHLVRGERLEHGCRWYFRHSDELVKMLHSLATREHECCPFVTFTLAVEGSLLVWETVGPSPAQNAIDMFYQLPRSLKRDDLATLKRAAEDAGVRLVGEGMEAP